MRSHLNGTTHHWAMSPFHASALMLGQRSALLDSVLCLLGAAQGKVVGHIQQTYAPDNGCGAFCRMCNKFTNYVSLRPRCQSKRTTPVSRHSSRTM